MNSSIYKRVINEANHVIETNNTIRETAKEFHVSKSTVHKDLQERLLDINTKLYEQVSSILDYHTKIRHIRGGESTKKKYLSLNRR